MGLLKLILSIALINWCSLVCFSQNTNIKNTISIGSNGDCGNNYFYNSNGTLFLKVTTTCDSLTGKRLSNDSLYADIDLLFYDVPDGVSLALNSTVDLNKAILTIVDSSYNIVYSKTLTGIEFPIETNGLTKGKYKLKVHLAKK